MQGKITQLPWATDHIRPAATTGLQITPIFGPLLLARSDTATVQAAINASIAALKAVVAGNATVQIIFEDMSGGLGQSSWNYYSIPYPTWLAAWKAKALSPDAITAAATLPSGSLNPVNNGQYIAVQQANASLLGLEPGAATATIRINCSLCGPGGYDLQSVAAHEINEVMGFGSLLNGLGAGQAPPENAPVWADDLFRYSAAGVRSFSTLPNTVAYYSIDGGKTSLAGFNQVVGGDFSDWDSAVDRVQNAWAGTGAPPLGVEIPRLNVSCGYQLAGGPVETSATMTIDPSTPAGFNTVKVPFGAPLTISALISGNPNVGHVTFTDFQGIALFASPVTNGQTQSFEYTVPVGQTSLSLNVNYSGGTGFQSCSLQMQLEVDFTSSVPVITNFSSNGRSMCTVLEVIFNEPVSLAAGAFMLTLKPFTADGVPNSFAGDATSVVSVINPSGDGISWTLSFSNPGGIVISSNGVVGGSAMDGNYFLNLAAGSATSKADATKKNVAWQGSFFRLFGDADGNGVVANPDLTQLKKCMDVTSTSDPRYNPAFDYFGTGVITNPVLTEFKKRFGMVWTGL